MTEQTAENIRKKFNKHVDSFRNKKGILHPMLQLKLQHTAFVVKNAIAVMQGENWNRGQTPAVEVAAILHDIGRFSQFAEFGTFRDSESVDHAERGIDIIEKLNIFAGATPGTAERISKAIRWHNKKSIPAETAPETAALAHLIRDADKLDIFRVMEAAIKDGSIEKNPEITWGLDLRGAPNPELVEASIRGEAVDYKLIQSFTDFILIQIGWIISGFHYDTSLKLVKERNIIEFRRNYLKTLTDDTAIDRCCDAAGEVLRQV
ncbi:MAG: HD domain-containing protein [Kiritimatiellia bacterium]